MDIPLPWERLLWRGRPALVARLTSARAVAARYVLTDFRLVIISRATIDELALQDVGEVHCRESALDRLIGASTIEVHSRDHRRAPLVLAAVRRGAQLAAVLELLSGDRHARINVNADAVAAALSWEPRSPASMYRQALAMPLALIATVIASAIGLHGGPAAITYAPDDAISPDGRKHDRDAIMRFMTADVLPWARGVLGPIVGGADRVRCETCHGRDADARGWRMPGVGALPVPDVQDHQWERYSSEIDAQMRNAIYGYVAQSDKQRKATYMREIVMPGMARLLHRAPYDFTKPYDYNRQHAAFGCYHCHKVK